MNDIYQITKSFWNSAPCGSRHLPELYAKEDKREYFEEFDKYFYNLYPYIKQFLKLKNMINKTVLEIGLGSGTTLGSECQYGAKVIGLDLSDETIALQKLRKNYYHLDNLSLINASACEIPLPDQSVDIVISIGCIHHIPDDDSVFREIYRVLKPNGCFKGMVYYKDSYRAKYYIPRRMRLDAKWKEKTFQQCVNEVYDGIGNPYAKLYSKKELSQKLNSYKKVNFKVHNFVPGEFSRSRIGKLLAQVPRKFYLWTLARIWGIDLYFTAYK